MSVCIYVRAYVCDQASNALIGWLPVFHSLSQTIDMQFCASTDGGQVCERGWVGDAGCACVRACVRLSLSLRARARVSVSLCMW